MGPFFFDIILDLVTKDNQTNFLIHYQEIFYYVYTQFLIEEGYIEYGNFKLEKG